VATSPRAIRSAATSRTRYSVSAIDRSSRVRSCSYCTRSRSACRFCASRISGAAYDACNDRASVMNRNGYGSGRRLGGAKTFHPNQNKMTNVIHAMKRQLPM